LSIAGRAGVKYYILVTGYTNPNMDAFDVVGTFSLDIEVSA
jgi:hypothetical protein